MESIFLVNVCSCFATCRLVWNTNVKVAELQNDLGDAEAVIEKLETELSDSERNSLQIVGIEKDIEYMKGALNRIENIVANGRF